MMLKPGIIFFIIVIAASCNQRKPAQTSGKKFAGPKQLAELKSNKLHEISGVASSVVNPGLLWVHNDSGNPSVIYLVDENLDIQVTCNLKGIRNRDWEDIAIGPGPRKGRTYLYVADIGDNNARHELKYIYRFEEPGTKNRTITIEKPEVMVFRLEDGRKDMEAIMVHPANGKIFLVSKREQPVFLYELPTFDGTSDTLVAEKKQSIPLTQIVSASISRDGKEVLMKNYDNIYYWNLKDKSVPDGLSSTPQILDYKQEPQGEAITFKIDNSGFYTLSEKVPGEKTFLYFYERLGD